MNGFSIKLLLLVLAVSLLGFVPGQDGWPPLYTAIRKGDLPAVKQLVEQGAAVNAKPGEWSPLMDSVKEGQEPIFDYLLSKGAEVDAVDADGCTVLHWAVAYRCVGAVQKLLVRHLNVNQPDNSGNTPLAFACERVRYLRPNQDAVELGSMAKLLLDAGAHINQQNKQGRTPLMLAATNGSSAWTHVLLERGADVSRRDEQSNTALLLAADHGYRDIAELLMQHGADVNVANQRRDTPLILASENGDARFVRLLLSHDADSNAQDNQGHTAYDRAIQINVGVILEGAGTRITGRKQAATRREQEEASNLDFTLYDLILADLRKDPEFRIWEWPQKHGRTTPLIFTETRAYADYIFGLTDYVENDSYGVKVGTALPEVMADVKRRNVKSVALKGYQPKFEARPVTRRQLERLWRQHVSRFYPQCVIYFSLPGYSADGNTAYVFFHYFDGGIDGTREGFFCFTSQEHEWRIARKRFSFL
jgi:ankyrin repeat protein